MTTETLVLPPRPSRPAVLPDPGTYRARPGRCVFELSAVAGRLTTLRGRFAVLDARLDVDQDDRDSRLTVEVSAGSLRTTRILATRRLTGPRGLAVRRHRVIRFESAGLETGEPGRLAIPGVLRLRGETVPVTLETRIVGRGRDRLLMLAVGRLDYSMLRATTEFRLPWSVPAGHISILLAADFR
jgi:polyisoprenoid-binding protein YceI